MTTAKTAKSSNRKHASTMVHKSSHTTNMKFSIFHRYQESSSSSSSRGVSIKEALKQLPPPPLVTSQESSTTSDHIMNMAQDELVSVILAMHETETGGAYDPGEKFTYPEQEKQPPNDECTKRNKKSLIVDVECRTRMLEWSSKMVDYFDLDRSIVAVAVGYQDRYMNTKSNCSAQTNRAMFRVVSVTSLYVAIKLRAPQRWNITAHAFAHLCQGAVTGQEINDMEIKILFALNWKVNPPCPMQYAQSFLELIFNPSSSQMCRSLSRCGDSFETLPSVRDILPLPDCSNDSRLTLDSSEISQEDQGKCRQELREHVLELVSYQFEIALHDKGFYRKRNSIIAIAAILNALEGVVYEHVGGTTFCRESMTLVLDTCDVYRIVSEEELEPVRSMLLSSVVPSTDDIDRVRQEGTVETTTATGESRCSSPPPRNDVTPPVSSSPTQVSTAKLFWSPSKMCEQVLTPQNVLSKLFAFR